MSAQQFYAWKFGDIHYIKRGWGEPLVLVHNLYAGASHEEFEHNIDELAHHFTVYAVDLLGFGLSDAPHITYTANTYTTLLRDFLTEVIGGPAHLVAAGLSCGYAADIAVFRPDLVRSVTMICPRSEPTTTNLPRWIAALRHFLISSPVLGNGFYETLSSRWEISASLKHCFANPARHVTRAKLDRLTEHAGRPGGCYPYASLVTGYLDTDLLKILPHVDVPVLLLWGAQAKPTPVEHSVRLHALLRHGRLEVVNQAGSWPHDEQSVLVNSLIERFSLAIETPSRPAETA
jgi:pimeloyl-ACP methyl ester carboxylesterase